MQAAYFAILGAAGVVTGAVIGFSNPTFDDGGRSHSDIRCGMAWGGATTGSKQDAALSTCAEVRSDRFLWSVTLSVGGLALLGCAPFASQGGTAEIAGPPGGLADRGSTAPPPDAD